MKSHSNLIAWPFVTLALFTPSANMRPLYLSVHILIVPTFSEGCRHLVLKCVSLSGPYLYANDWKLFDSYCFKIIFIHFKTQYGAISHCCQ